MGDGNDAAPDRLRALPAVHELADALAGPHSLAVAAARRAIDEERKAVRSGDEVSRERVLQRAQRIVDSIELPSLRAVINATGVIIHTNLGRAPLPAAARGLLTEVAEGYSNLELDLEQGKRGSRQAHVEELLCELTGAEAALTVNNGAAAVLLSACALAGPGCSIIVSRGQLVEIGGGFRIPDVVAQSGSRLIEVGTTNKTRREDYERAIREDTGAILRVHQSNFRALGFVEEVPIEELCRLGVPVIDDVGSGALATGIPALADEPALKRSIDAGAAIVCCSADKLLGGPQAGLLVGDTEAIRGAREHPLARAVRIDKLSLAALEATLSLYRDPALARHEIPVLAMLEAGEEELAVRARAIRDAIGDEHCELVRAKAKVGGGALPLLELDGPAVALICAAAPAELAAALRSGDPPVIARIHEGRVLLDPRTLPDDEVGTVARAARDALASIS